MENDVEILTDEEMKKRDREQNKKLQDSCGLMMLGMERLSEAMKLMEKNSDEFMSLMHKRVALLEPLGMMQSKSGFKDWMYKDWKEKRLKAENEVPWDGESV